LSGKFFVAALLAASTTSAATVGVVYTGVVSPRHGEGPAAAGGSAPATGAVTSAVVLNAQEGFFERFAGSSDAPVCPSLTDARGCVTVSGASSPIRLSFLGLTVTIPAVWLGGDSQDQAWAQESPIRWLDGFPPSPANPWIGGARTQGVNPSGSAQSEQGADSGPQDGSRAAPALALSSDAGFDARPIVETTSGDAFEAIDPIVGAETPPVFAGAPAIVEAPEPPVDWLPPAAPLISGQASLQTNAPEPSTWLMLLAGAVALGVIGRRRAGRAAAHGTTKVARP